MTQRVLVTGGSGFIAGHCILQLLDQGAEVRTTVRSLGKEAQVRAVLEGAGMTRGDRLTFAEADLTRDHGWAAAVADVDVVLHVASPVAPGRVRDEDAVVRPAREGTVRVLRAALDSGVRRTVVTSAFHAVGFGQPRDHGLFTEDDWTPLHGPVVDAYGRSKVLAERAAWDLAAGGPMELVTLLPVAVMGPVMGDGVSGSNHLIQNMLPGRMPGLPDLAIPVVDVRDVAAAHVAATTAPEAAGRRVLVATGEPAVPMRRMAQLLRQRLGDRAAKVPTRNVPDLVVRAAGLFNPELRGAAADLGFVKQVSDERLRRILGVAPRPSEEAIVAAAESLLAKSLV
jgi:nucleoside-diphosphate-sugar epimerase